MTLAAATATSFSVSPSPPPPPPSLSPSSASLRTITVEEVAWHDGSYGDFWLVIYDRVYDVTRFLDEHPGGGDVLLECAGRDATVAFRGAGHGGRAAAAALRRFLIGELPPSERIFRKAGGIRLGDVPE